MNEKNNGIQEKNDYFVMRLYSDEKLTTKVSTILTSNPNATQ